MRFMTRRILVFVSLACLVTIAYEPLGYQTSVSASKTEGVATIAEDSVPLPESNHSDSALRGAFEPEEVFVPLPNRSNGEILKRSGETVLRETDSAYYYGTQYGTYVMQKNESHYFRVHSLEGHLSVAWSSFCIGCSGPFSALDSQILVADEMTYVSAYEVSIDMTRKIEMQLRIDFYDNKEPKITASVERPISAFDRNMQISWVVVSSSDHMGIGNREYNLRYLGDTYEFANTHSSAKFIDKSDDSFQHTLARVSWKESRSESVRVVRLDKTEMTRPSWALVVSFEKGKRVIDPEIIAGNPSTSTTANQAQRKIFHYETYYWAFYYDGTGIQYKHSHDGFDWSEERTAYEGVISSTFDVDQRGPSIAVAWLVWAGWDSWTHFRNGTIVGNTIRWSQETTIYLGDSDHVQVGVCIATDSRFYVSVLVHPDVTPTVYDVLVVVSSDGQSFSIDLDKADRDLGSKSTIDIVPLANSSLMVLWDETSDNKIHWVVREPDGGYSAEYTVGNFPMFSANQDRRDNVTAVSTYSGEVNLAVVTMDNKLEYWKYDSEIYSNFYKADTAYVGPPASPTMEGYLRYPTISYESGDLIHLFWTKVGWSLGENVLMYDLCIYGKVWNRCRDPLEIHSFAPGHKPYISASSYVANLASLMFLSDQASEGLQFLSFPLLTSTGPVLPEPTESSGLRVNQDNAGSQRVETILPSTGQLVMRESDLLLPGRAGLDLPLSRVYVQPRAFIREIADTDMKPYYSDTFPWANMGPVWSLDLPWVDDQFLHLPGGQKYVLDYENDDPYTDPWVFENHVGEHFVLSKNPYTWEYELVLASGMTYTFHADGKPLGMQDERATTVMTFQYDPVDGSLDKIDGPQDIDLHFGYVNGRLSNAMIVHGVVPLRVVEYRYDLDGFLSEIERDPDLTVTGDERTTEFTYWTSNHNLIRRVTYPTMGFTEYSWAEESLGTEALTFRPEYKTVWSNKHVPIHVGTDTFDFFVNDGRVLHTEVTHKDSSGLVKGYTAYDFSSMGNSVTTRILDDSGNVVQKVTNSYDSRGNLVQQDVLAGESLDSSYVNFFAYDNWGNTIYAGDPIGRESYGSYSNNDHQMSFLGSATVKRTSSGRIFFDDFSNRSFDLSGWDDTSSDPCEITFADEKYLFQPPSLHIAGDGATNFNCGVYHHFTPFLPSDEIISFTISTGGSVPSSTYKVVFTDSSVGGAWRLYLMISGGTLYWKRDSGHQEPLYDYEDGDWLEVTLKPRYDGGDRYFMVWVNGKIVGSVGYWQPNGFGEIDGIHLSAHTSPTGDLWIDRIKIQDSDKIFIVQNVEFSGRPAGQGLAMLTSYQGTTIDREGIYYGPPPHSELDVLPPHFYRSIPFLWSYPGRIRIFTDPLEEVRISHFLEFTSPFMDFFGGDELSWVHRYDWTPSLELSRSGHYDLPDVWLRDFPTGTEESGNDEWKWGAHGEFFPSFYPVPAPQWESARSHWSELADGLHWHGLKDQPFTDLLTSDFFIQYVYLEDGTSPAEVMLQFHDADASSWEHRAFWGEQDWTGLGTVGTPSLSWMGDLPSTSGRWTQLLVRASDVGLGDTWQTFDGVRYTLVGGSAFWDMTAIGDWSFGSVRINGLPQGWRVEMDVHRGDVTVALQALVGPSGVANFDLYDCTGATVYPVTAYIRVYGPSPDLELKYSSPLIEIWAGDQFDYSDNDFFGNEGVLSHGKKTGGLVFLNQNGKFDPEAEQRPSYSHYSYSSVGDLLETKVSCDAGWPTSCGGGWVHESLTYDSYGNIDISTNRRGRITSYDYEMYSSFLNTVTDLETSILVDYDHLRTGELWKLTNGRGYVTEYSYDYMGRLREILYPAVGPVQSTVEYTYSRDPIDEHDILLIKDENDHYQQIHYDGLGRLSRREMLDSSLSLYSYEEFHYDIHDEIMTHTVLHDISATPPQEYVYQTHRDILGRVVEVVNPDGTSSFIEYDNDDNSVMVLDEEGFAKGLKYDWVAQLTSVREYPIKDDTGTCYETLYEYDGIGNLVSVTDAKDPSESTAHSYDDLGRLSRIDYPDTTYELFEYDYSGNLVKTWKRDGSRVDYLYDSLNRLTDADYPSGRTVDYFYDEANNIERVEDYISTQLEITEEFDYDERERLTREHVNLDWQGIGTWPWEILYDYDGVGNVKHMTYPYGNLILTYEYDDFNRLDYVSEPGLGTIASFEYFEDGLFKEMYQGGILETFYDYLLGGRVQSIETRNSATQDLISERVHSYYDNGMVEQVDIYPANDYEYYIYDGVGRLTDAQRSLGWDADVNRIEYTYDDVGNRVQMKDHHIAGGSQTTTYDHLAGNKLYHTYLDSGTITYAYDDNGNLNERDDGTTRIDYTYDVDDRLTNILATDISTSEPIYELEFYYDFQGRRLIEIRRDHTLPEPGCQSFVSMFAGNEPIMVEDTGCMNLCGPEEMQFYANGMHVMSYEHPLGGQKKLYVQDALGSVRVVTDDIGTILSTVDYRPFGLEVSGPAAERFKFIDRQESWPDDLDLYHFGARYYDPETGRFVSADPVAGSKLSPQSLNLYQYALNNPSTTKDEDGRFVWFLALAFLIGASANTAAYHFFTPETERTDAGYVGSFIGGGVAGVIAATTAGTSLSMSIMAGAWSNTAAYVIESAFIGSFSSRGILTAAAVGGLIGVLECQLNILQESGAFDWIIKKLPFSKSNTNSLTPGASRNLKDMEYIDEDRILDHMEDWVSAPWDEHNFRGGDWAVKFDGSGSEPKGLFIFREEGSVRLQARMDYHALEKGGPKVVHLNLDFYRAGERDRDLSRHIRW